MKNRTWGTNFCPGSSDGHDLEERAVSSTTSSTDDDSRNSGMDTYLDRNSNSGSELSELALHTLHGPSGDRKSVSEDPEAL